MKSSKFKIILLSGIVAIMVIPLLLRAQSLQEQLQQCPVIIENGKINYYMPQQNGAYFQLPPARKPQYVNMFTVPWVQPLTQSVKETQNQVLAQLLAQSKQTNLASDDKSLFLRKLTWCVMLQTSKAKEIDTEIIDFVRQLGEDSDVTVSSQAKLVRRLMEDYGKLNN
jgi:hypothetical protein